MPQQRFLCSESDGKSSSNNNNLEYPKLPIEAAAQFAMSTAKASIQQIAWIMQQELNRDDVIQANEGAEKILTFITECLSEGNFDVLEEKLTPEALEKARSVVPLMSPEKKKYLIFSGSSSSFWFSSDLQICVPWKFDTDGNSVTLGYFALRVTKEAQTAWHLSLNIPRDGSSLSEDFKVCDFFWETYALPKNEEES